MIFLDFILVHNLHNIISNLFYDRLLIFIYLTNIPTPTLNLSLSSYKHFNHKPVHSSKKDIKGIDNKPKA